MTDSYYQKGIRPHIVLNYFPMDTTTLSVDFKNLVAGIFVGVFIEKLNYSARRRRDFRDNLQQLAFKIQNAQTLCFPEIHQSTLEDFNRYAAAAIEDLWWNKCAFEEACNAYRKFSVSAKVDDSKTLMQAGFITRQAARTHALELLVEVTNQTKVVNSICTWLKRIKLSI